MKERIQGALTNATKTSFVEDVNNDVTIFQEMLSRPNKASEKEIKDEQKRANVLKRLALIIGSGDMQISSSKGSIAASANTLPVASYLAGHAGRVLIEIPAGSGDSLFNYITNGNSKIGVSDEGSNVTTSRISGDKAKERGKIFFNRRAATHDTKITEAGVKEVKTTPQRELFLDVIPSLFRPTKHWGMNIASGDYAKKDIHGNKITANGAHGHLYLHYNPPTKTKPGSIMFGIEGTEPGVTGELGEHSLLGKPDKISPFRGKKWDKPNDIINDPINENIKNRYVIPQKYTGMKITLDSDKLEKIVSQDTDNLGDEIATKMPSNSVEGFNFSIEYNKENTIIKSKILVLTPPPKKVPKLTLMGKIKKSFFPERKTIEVNKENDDNIGRKSISSDSTGDSTISTSTSNISTKGKSDYLKQAIAFSKIDRGILRTIGKFLQNIANPVATQKQNPNRESVKENKNIQHKL